MEDDLEKMFDDLVIPKLPKNIAAFPKPDKAFVIENQHSPNPKIYFPQYIFFSQKLFTCKSHIPGD